MDENRADILQRSTDTLNKLQLLSVFFDNNTIYRIYLRCQVIHRLFEGNQDLDANKLDLFHVQFTSSVLDLLKKIKKGNEQNELLLVEEIRLNKDLISKLGDTSSLENNYNMEKQRHSLKINISLKNLYGVLSDDSSDYPFSKNLNSFSAQFAQDFFYTITPELYTKLTTYDPALVYTNAYATIHKKLLGAACKYEFRSEFYYGLKTGDRIVEIFKFLDADRYFLYSPSKGTFLFCDPVDVATVDRTNSFSKKAQILHELKDKNDSLNTRMNAVKTHMPPEVETLLNDAYLKISDVDFLQNMNNIDAQSNILRAMLNTNMM